MNSQIFSLCWELLHDLLNKFLHLGGMERLYSWPRSLFIFTSYLNFSRVWSMLLYTLLKSDLHLLKSDLYLLQPTDMYQQKTFDLELPEFNHEAPKISSSSLATTLPVVFILVRPFLPHEPLRLWWFWSSLLTLLPFLKQFNCLFNNYLQAEDSKTPLLGQFPPLRHRHLKLRGPKLNLSYPSLFFLLASIYLKPEV